MKFKKFFISFILLIPILYNTVSFGVSNPPEIIADSAILIDSTTEKVLYSKNETKKMYPASTTKILTAILTLENCNLSDTVIVPYEAISSIPSGYSVAALQPGERLTVEELLKVLLVHSSNDAANVLAYHISGSIDNFAQLMNNKIAELGIQNTHFTNPSGMHDENHYTTAYDLSIIMKYCMQNSNFRTLSGLKYCQIPATNKYESRVFNTTNELLTKQSSSNYYYKYAICGKTGYTTEAKNCLVSVSNKNDLELICVVLGAGLYPNNLSGRFVDSKALFEYGYDNYTIRKFHDKGAIATEIEIPKATKETKTLSLLLENDITAVIPQNDLETEFTPDIKLNENISAPIAQNQVVGTITYDIDGIKYTSNLLASHNVERSKFFTLIMKVILIIFILYLLKTILFNTKMNKKKKRKSRRKTKRK